MALKTFKPYTPSRRFLTMLDKSDITKQTPEKSLVESKKRTGGRNSHGEVTSWHRGGGHARKYRSIDFRREKLGIPAKVAAIEYDPNRSARIALLQPENASVDPGLRLRIAQRGEPFGEPRCLPNFDHV